MIVDADLRQLRAVQAVVREGSFGRAAQQLGYTQSAISQQVAALERSIGATIFDRPGGRRSVTLTAVGELVLEVAGDVLDVAGRADDRLRSLLSGESGRLLIGSFQTVSVRILPQVVSTLRGERPNVVVRCRDLSDRDELMESLRRDEFDLAFLVDADDCETLEITDLFLDPYVLVAPLGDYPPVIGLDALDHTGLIGEPEGFCQRLVDDRLRQRGLEPEYVFRSGDYTAVQAMVRSGVGAAILPLLAVALGDPSVAVSAFEPALPPRRIQIAKRRDRTLPPIAARFVEIATSVCTALPALDDAVAV